MQIRKMTFLALAVLVFSLASSAFAQLGAQKSSPHPILGYYDPATGSFQPLQSAEAEAPPVAPTTGTLTMKYTITVDATIPKNGVVSCTGSASTGDTAGSYQESGQSVATLVSGKTYSCSVIIHYSWLLASPSTDKIGFAGGVDLDYGYQVTATNGSATIVQPVNQRHSSESVPTISVPANGATTTISINSTL